MSSNILNHKVLKLNKNWQALDVTTLEDAVNRLNSSKNPYSVIKIEYGKDQNGNYDFDNPLEFTPLFWNDWIKLAPRPFDEVSVRTSSMEIRIPTVIITHTFSRPPKPHKLKPTNTNLMEIYEGRDYWTGKILPKSRVSKDHLITQEYCRTNGLYNIKDTWGNLALTDRDINAKRGNMTVEEFTRKYPEYKPHYELRKTPPEKIKEITLAREAMCPDFRHFLFK